MKFYVYYLFVEGEKNPFYVGKSFLGSRRLNEHKCHSRGGHSLKDRKIQKALKEGKRIIEKIVSEVETETEAHAIEKALILIHGRKDIHTGFLTNHTNGGEGISGLSHSEESKEKMRINKIGNKINVGRKRPDMIERFSKEITAFDKDGIPIKTFSSAREAEKELGVCHKNISMVLNGRDGAKFTKNKKTGLIYHFRYGNITDKVNIGAFRTKKSTFDIIQYNKGGNEINRFEKIKDAESTTGLKGISQCLSGKLKTCGGFVWKKEPREG